VFPLCAGFTRLPHVLALLRAAPLVFVLGSPGMARADSLSLEECLARAGRTNPSIRAADHEIDAAKARLRQAGALEPPNLSYLVGKLGTPVSGEEREAELRVSQDFSAPGQRGRAARVARTDVALAEAGRESFLLELRGDVTRFYRRLQADRLNTRTLEGLRNTATDLEEMVQARLRSGSARYLDVLRARAERVRLENDLIEAERALREDRRTLNTLMARTPDEPFEPLDSLGYVPLSDSLLAVLDRARSSRPRLRVARLEIERAAAQIALAKAGRLPATSFGAGLDRVPGWSSPGFGAEMSLSLPFLPWTDRRAKVSEAKAVQGTAEARLELAEREVELAIRNAYEAAQSAERQVQQFNRLLLADAADGIRTAIQNYQAGQIDALELFETLRTYRAVRIEHIRALVNYELSLTDLAVAE
jgi:outer membrane protein, heavy metal efflux system